jgi:hypothetical protein
MKNLVTIRISSRDWETTLENTEWDERPPTPVCFISLIRLYKTVKDISLGDAKRTIEEAAGRNPTYGEFKFLLDDAAVGRLYMFLRYDNTIIDRKDGHLPGYEVIDISTYQKGGIIV